MKILHTSDWHIGSTFYGKKRHEEFSAFFDWLYSTVQENDVRVLLVSGDIFDTVLPSNTAQSLYYSFLVRLLKSSCRHVIVTGGNHDSPSFLNAPKQLLKTLDIHVIGAVPDNMEEEVICINEDGEELFVLAVPYLRERDLQGVSIADSFEDRARKITEGIKNHYQKLTEIALAKKKNNGRILAMGHLFITGSSLEEEGERELYVGSLAQISAAVFPKEIDYTALGHIHSAQKIGGCGHIRYSGSPLAMSFSERKHTKKVLLLDTKQEQDNGLHVTEITVPEFQAARKICGDFNKIQKEINAFKAEGKSVWLEIEYTGQEEFSLKDRLYELTENSSVEILKYKNQNLFRQYFAAAQENKNLEDFTPLTVFREIINKSAYPAEEQEELLSMYREILSDMQEKDLNE